MGLTFPIEGRQAVPQCPFLGNGDLVTIGGLRPDFLRVLKRQTRVWGSLAAHIDNGSVALVTVNRLVVALARSACLFSRRFIFLRDLLQFSNDPIMRSLRPKELL